MENSNLLPVTEYLNKYRDYGFMGLLNRTLQIFSQMGRFYYYTLPWGIKVQFYSNLARLLFTSVRGKKRILGVWDYSSLPWSVGDPLVFIEAVSVLKLRHEAEAVDLCIVCDRDKPMGIRSASIRKDNVNSNNVDDYMLDFLPLFSTSPFPGSVYQFNEREEMYRFIKMNADRYEIYPPLTEHLGKSYIFHRGAAPEVIRIQDFFSDYGFIPHLRIGERETKWAHWFYRTRLPEGAFPVTLSMKQTMHTPERNADPRIWLAFVDRCREEFPEIVFVANGLREEVFDGLRERQNVLVAKDFGTTVVEDLALIRTSLMYMGTNSGVNTIAVFSDLPYLIFQMPDWCFAAHNCRSGKNLNFATDKQKMFSTTFTVTADSLFEEFLQLYMSIDKSRWLERSCQARNKHTHPTARVEQENP